jgi:hypothetical protein
VRGSALQIPFTAERVSDGKLIKVPCNVVRGAFLAVEREQAEDSVPA